MRLLYRCAQQIKNYGTWICMLFLLLLLLYLAYDLEHLGVFGGGGGGGQDVYHQCLNVTLSVCCGFSF